MGTIAPVLGHYEWLDPVISAAAAILGALVGGGVVLLVARAERKDRREQEHRAALTRYWAAANAMAVTIGSFVPSGSLANRVLTNIEQHLQLGHIMERMYATSDAFWEAGGRLRAVATERELNVVNEVERVLADWKVGEPLPAEWTPAIGRLRECVEGVGAA